MSNALSASEAGFLGKLVTAVRLVLGVEFLVNGLNWWVKLIDPYPSISDFVNHTLPAGNDPAHNMVAAMIAAGVFHLVKGLELTAGVALLTDLWVPTALVLVAPVTVNVFIVDVFLSNHLRGRLMGSGALLMSVFLMLAYFNTYRPMLVRTARRDGAGEARPFAWFDPLSRPWRTALMIPLGLASLAIGLVMIGWVFLMIGQHFTRH